MRLFIILLTFYFGNMTALAQDRSGNDTAGEWIVTHHYRFGEWDSICDKRDNTGGLEQRCYVRYVDVFSQAPKFGAVFLFITPEVNGYKIQIGTEHGTHYVEDGFGITSNNLSIWTLPNNCLRKTSCIINDAAALNFINAAKIGGNNNGNIKQTFIDRYGQSQNLLWSLHPFKHAFQDFEISIDKRNLR